MKYRQFFLALILTLLFASCEGFLDVKPTGKLIPTEVNQIDNLLNANKYNYFFMDNGSMSSYAYLGDNIEITPNERDYYYIVTNLDRYASYIFYKPFFDPTSSVHYFWSWGLYEPMAIYNTVIDGIANLGKEVNNTEYAKSVVAQAKAGRAYMYLIATVVWGPMWDPSGDNSARVLPYRIDPSPPVVNPDLSTTEEMFDLVKKDLDEALVDIPEIVASPIRVNKSAIHGIYAHYYMFKRDWQNMLTSADASLKAAGSSPDQYIYDLNDFKYKYIGTPPSDGTDHEVILSLEYEPNLLEPFNEPLSREFAHYKRSSNSWGVYPSEDWLAIFDRENDLRYKMFVLTNHGYKSGNNDDGLRLYNYRNHKMLGNTGISYPELLLMRAEAYARLSQLPQALADLNTLRSFRFDKSNGQSTDHPDGATLVNNKDKLLEEILTERRREQCSHSFFRTIDLKRYVYDTGKPWSKTSVSHTLDGKTYSIDLTDKMAFTLPYPNETIRYNPHWGLTEFEGVWDPKK